MDISKLRVTQEGKVVLSDDELLELARQAVPAAGAWGETNAKCGKGDTNWSCTNSEECKGSKNVGCTNQATCHHEEEQ